MTERNSAAIYTRISKDREGTELGIDRQEQDCRRLAEQLGLEVVAVFRDNDISASTLSAKKRPAYEDMLARARSGEFGTILAYSNSRLTRRVREYLDLIDIFRDKRVVVRTVVSSDHDLSTADGRAVALTVATWDQAEAERTSERIKRQKRQRAERGEWHGGAAPYGYRLDNKRLTPNPAEVALVEQAARRLVQDREPLHSIVKDWNDSGVPTRSGKHWRQTNLRSILMNRSLLGETKAGVVGWDPIIDARTFDRLQAIFTDISRKVTHSPGVKGGKYSMGGGLTVCGLCGKPLTSARRSGSVRASLVCNRQVQGPDPKNHPQVERVVKGKIVKQDTGRVRIDHDRLEAHVFRQVIELLEDAPRWQARMAEQDPRINSTIDELEDQRSELRAERDRAQRGFVAGIMGEADAKREVDRVNAELAQLEARINDLLGRPILADVIAQGIDWQAWPPGRRRAFLRLLVDRVVVSEAQPGAPRNSFRRSGETDADYAARLDERAAESIARRVQIVWRWEASSM